jgi:ornithine cyclodeaminase/alanine dehydrogenase-like protein (mu-crystallin family)
MPAGGGHRGAGPLHGSGALRGAADPEGPGLGTLSPTSPPPGNFACAGRPAEPVAELSSGLAAADIVTCATTAKEPVLRAEHVRPGTHVDLVGAFTRDMRESDDALVSRAELFVDTFAGALKEAGDLVQPIEAGTLHRTQVLAELADLVSGRHVGRTARHSVTLFKSVGTALEDLCAARLVLERL